MIGSPLFVGMLQCTMGRSDRAAPRVVQAENSMCYRCVTLAACISVAGIARSRPELGTTGSKPKL